MKEGECQRDDRDQRGRTAGIGRGWLLRDDERHPDDEEEDGGKRKPRGNVSALHDGQLLSYEGRDWGLRNMSCRAGWLRLLVSRGELVRTTAVECRAAGLLIIRQHLGVRDGRQRDRF